MTLIIQIVISVLVIYLIFSVMVFVIVEWFTMIIRLRGKMLRDALFNLFNDIKEKKGMGERLYNHPQIEKLMRDHKLPSYIPATNVTLALIDLIKSEKAPDANDLPNEDEKTYQQFKQGLLQLEDGPLKKLLTSITGHSRNLAFLTISIEKWYNEYMDRVTGWYKVHVRNIVLVVSALVTLAFNIDTIHIIKVAATDPKTRERLNLLADEVLKDSLITNAVLRQENFQDYYDEYVNDDSFDGRDSIEKVLFRDSLVANYNNESLDQLIKLNQMVRQWDLPVGWEIKKDHGWPLIILGWILSTLALSAGGPFWFDLLKRLVNVRNAGIKPLVPNRPEELK
ncbi:MAG TPA: hypothetical protein VFU29_06900 [Chitinophagaceae bacterium]|nr:hypothetical protein [Chitinophagaceae bacterium]